jgi:hypothetical protein
MDKNLGLPNMENMEYGEEKNIFLPGNERCLPNI